MIALKPLVRRLWFAIAFTGCLVVAAHAIQEIGWRDLTVPIDPQDDPFFGLEFEQKVGLEQIMLVESMRKNGDEPNERLTRLETEAIEALAVAGLNASELVEKSIQFRLKIALQRNSVRQEWDDADVRIPGYMLPLEFDGTNVTEFLLVPYVGACIHTPPPPANQIIHVTSTTGFEADGLFTPVWVSGRLTVERSQQSVGLSDGSSGFEVGYALTASQIEEYTQ